MSFPSLGLFVSSFNMVSRELALVAVSISALLIDRPVRVLYVSLSVSHLACLSFPPPPSSFPDFLSVLFP